ncbi:GSCOCG00011451001-RA-CDS, partial [Cotesia congregata]
MTKEKNKNQYVQKYRKEWELDVNFKGWLSEVPGDSQAAHCKLCKSNLKAHKKNLNDHLNSTKHKEAIKRDKTIVHNQKIDTFIKPTILEERKIVELRIAVFIAKNCSIRAVVELSVLIKSLDKSSKILNEIKLHRTKCTSLVLNVIAPCMLQELIEDIVEFGEATALYDAFTNNIKDSGLNLNNLIGIGVDGVNAMVGAHN